MSLRLRALLAFLGLGVAVLGVAAWLVASDVRPHMFGATEESVVETAVLLASLVEAEMPADDLALAGLRSAVDRALHRPLAARIYDTKKTGVKLRVYVTDAQGVVRYDSDGGGDEGRNYSTWRDVSRALKGEYGARATRAVAGDPFSSTFYVTMPLRRGEAIVGALAVGKPAGDVKGLVYSLYRKVALAGAAGLVVAVVLGLGLARWINRPLARLQTYAREVSEGRRPALPELEAREVAALGRTLESMRAALDGRRDVEGYVRGLTHETKAPITAIRAAAELLGEDLPPEDRRRFLANIRTESERLERLVDRLLELSALEARHSLKDVAPLDLGAIVRGAADGIASAAEQKGIAIEVQASPTPRVTGDALLVGQALSNLLHNALRWTPTGGGIVIRAFTDATHAVVEVSDTGPGLPDYARPRVFDRFYSLAAPGEGRGTGLGLPFVREVAVLHGGEAALENGKEGGARATLRLPLSRA